MLHNGREDNLDLILRKANIDVLQYTPRMATIAAQIMDKKGDGRCKTCGKVDWADIMIYSSIDNPPTILVTRNITDFPYERVKTPEEIMEMFSGRFSPLIEVRQHICRYPPEPPIDSVPRCYWRFFFPDIVQGVVGGCKNPYATAKQISEHLGLSVRTIRRHVSSLTERGYISREGTTRGGRFYISYDVVNEVLEDD